MQIGILAWCLLYAALIFVVIPCGIFLYKATKSSVTVMVDPKTQKEKRKAEKDEEQKWGSLLSMASLFPMLLLWAYMTGQQTGLIYIHSLATIFSNFSLLFVIKAACTFWIISRPEPD